MKHKKGWGNLVFFFVGNLKFEICCDVMLANLSKKLLPLRENYFYH